MARPPVTTETRDRLELGADEPVNADRAQYWEDLAADPQPEDEVNVSEMLVIAAEHREMAGETDRAIELYRRAVELGQPVSPDVRCYFVQGLLQAGRRDEADEVARAIRSSKPQDPMTYELLGQSYEQVEDLSSAIRWYTAAVMATLRTPGAPDYVVEQALVSRARVRSAEGFPPDDLDEKAREMLIQRMSRQQQPAPQ